MNTCTVFVQLWFHALARRPLTQALYDALEHLLALAPPQRN